MTGSFGERLRRQRESRHITLADVASATKIQAALFEGLERDDVSRWPAGIFRRAFIRAYADAIGLDPEAVCREFVERFPERAPGAALAGASAPASVARSVPPSSRVPSAGADNLNSPPVLRLTLADTPFTRRAAGLGVSGVRAVALACDAAVPSTIALAAFVAIGSFWMPLAVAALAYCLGSLFIIGTTPGLWLLAVRWTDQPRDISAPPLPESPIGYQPVDMDSTRARA